MDTIKRIILAFVLMFLASMPLSMTPSFADRGIDRLDQMMTVREIMKQTNLDREKLASIGVKMTLLYDYDLALAKATEYNKAKVDKIVSAYQSGILTEGQARIKFYQIIRKKG